MSFRPDHELHQRRMGRNFGLGGALLAFVALVFILTIVKVTNEGHDRAQHATQSSATDSGAAQTTGTTP